MKIVGVSAHDIRFPTSRELDGSDAMNPDPDYSAAYVVLRRPTGRPRRPRPDLHHRPRQRAVRRRDRGAARRCRRARRSTSIARRHGRASGGSSPATASCAGSARRRASIHLATGAVVNAVWDLWAKAAGKPLWQLLADMTPEQLVALRRLPLPHRRAHAGRGARDPARSSAPARPSASAELRRDGYPGLHHVGRLARLLRRASCAGSAARRSTPAVDHFKMKVGGDLDDDIRRAAHRPRGDRRRPQPDDRRQPGWDVDEAIELDARRSRRSTPVDRGADQPRRRARPRARSRARSRPIGVATGEHVPEPRDVQAAAAGRRDRLLPDRRLPARRASTRCSRCC